MKKSLKLSLISILGVFFAFCMIFSTVGMSKVKADAPALTSFKLVEGAYIRTENPVGIRFETGISKAEKANLPEGTKFGTIIALDSQLQGAELTLDSSVNKVIIETKNWLSTTEPTMGSEYDAYYGTLVGGTAQNPENFEEQYYSEVFVARGYVTVDGTTYYTPNTIERTIAGVAKRASDNGQGNSVTANILTASEGSKVELTFDAGEGTGAPETKSLWKGEILDIEPAEIPTKEGSIFTGWYYDSACTEPAYKGEIIKASKTVYAGWRTLPASQTFSGSILSLVDDTKGTYAPKDAQDLNGIYVYEKTAAPEKKFSELQIDVDATEYMFREGAYIVMEVKASSAVWVMVGTSDYGYIAYDRYNNLIGDNGGGKVTVGAWCKVGHKIGSVDGANSETIGISAGTGTLEIRNFTIYSSEEAYNAAMAVVPAPTKVEYDGSILKLLNTEGATYTKDEDTGNYVLTKTAANSPDAYKDLGFDMENVEIFSSGNYVVIDMISTTNGWICFGGSGGNDEYNPYDTSFVAKEDNTRPWVDTQFKAIHKIGDQAGNQVVYDCSTFGSSSGQTTWTIIKITIYTEAEYLEAVANAEPAPEPEPVGFVTCGANVLSKTYSAETYTYEEEAMTGDYEADAKSGTYKLNNISHNTAYLNVNKEAFNGLYVNDNYLVINAYIATRANNATSRFRFWNVFDASGNQVSQTLSNNNMDCDVAVKTWYTIVVKISDIVSMTGSIDYITLSSNDKVCEIYVSSVSVYTPEALATVLPNAVAE